MEPKKKKRKIRIERVIPILIVIVFVIINYIVIPPKVSLKAEKYWFSPFNIVGLESITVDENKIVYKFSSLSRVVTLADVIFKKSDINGFYLTGDNKKPFDQINIDSANKVYFTLTSKYIVLNRNGNEDFKGLKIMKETTGTYIWELEEPEIQLNKYDYGYNELNGIYQEYHDGWDKPKKYSTTIYYFE